MATCEFCGKKAQIVWTKAQINLFSVVEKMKNEQEEEQVEILANLITMLQNRSFEVESNEFVNIKLKRTEFVRTCSDEKDCSFWFDDGIAEADKVNKIIDFEGLLIN